MQEFNGIKSIHTEHTGGGCMTTYITLDCGLTFATMGDSMVLVDETSYPVLSVFPPDTSEEWTHVLVEQPHRIRMMGGC